MDSNTQFRPPSDYKPTFTRISDSSEPMAPIVSNHKSRLIKIIIGPIIVTIVATGTYLYLWQNDQANIKKNQEIAKAKIISDKAAEQKKASGESINNTIPLSDFVGSGTAVKARSAKAQSNAVAARSVAEIMNVEIGYYPRTTTDFVSYKLAADIIPLISDPTEDNGQTTFRWEYIGPSLAPTGGRITYWDYTTNAISANVYYVGTATSESKFVIPAS